MSKPEGTKTLNINLKTELCDRIDKFRHQQMFTTRTEAIEFLIDLALKQRPKRDSKQAEDGK